MKIVRYADIPNNRTGGMSRYIHFASDEMRLLGHEVDLVFSDRLGNGQWGRWGRFVTPIQIVRDVRQRLHRGEPIDLVEIHEPSAAIYAAMRRFDPSLPPVLVTVYALESRAHRRRLEYAKSKGIRVSWKSRISPLSVIWQANFGLCHADHITVETREDLAFLRNEFGIPGNRITLQHGGVDPHLFQDGSTSRKGILFMGTWIERKGILDLVPAVVSVLQRHPDLPVTIAGCGCSEEAVLSSFPESVRQKIRVIPRITENEELAQIYYQHQIFAFPSTFEGQPLVLLEAAACGLAIVTTRTCGMRDFIQEGVNGLSVDYGQIESFTSALMQVVEQPTYAKQLGLAAQETAKIYTWRRSAAQFLHAAHQAIDHPRIHRRSIWHR